jgi:uncharacterized membrane protein
MGANDTPEEIDGLTKFLRVPLGLGVVVAVVSLLSSAMQAELLSRTFTEAEGHSNDTRELIIGLSQFVLYLLTVIVFGRWIVRANKNVRALGASGLRVTPGWAVGYFFVPIVSLWKPYQAMKDLWRASQNPAAWTSTATGFLLPAWWTLWLLWVFLGQASLRVTLAAGTLEQLQAATYLQMVSQVVDVPLFLVAMALVTGIANAQKRHAHIGTSTTPTPPEIASAFAG